MLALGKLLELTLAGREPSEKIQVCASGARLRWRLDGVLAVDPPAGRDGGVDLLLSAGIHGDESAAVELLERLLHDIAACRLVPAVRLLLVLGNPAALRRGVRYVEHDLDELFGGHDPSASGADALRAVELELQAAQFFAGTGRRRWHLDLRAGARPSQVGPFAVRPPRAQPPSRAELASLQAAGIAALLLEEQPAATFAAFTATHCAAESLALELGAAPGALERPLAWLRLLIAGGVPAGDASALRLFRSSRELRRHGQGFRLYVDEAAANFAALPPGSLLAEDGDGRRWLVEETDARIVFANPRAAEGQRAGLVAVPLALDAPASE